MTNDNKTIDPSQSQLGGTAAPAVVPQMRLLYHIDLDRIGALSDRNSPLAAGRWQAVGRFEPFFSSPDANPRSFTLDDPTISRLQFECRWLPRVQRFEVVPAPQARRKLLCIEPTETRTIDAPVWLEPGQCIAIEDRALLGLEIITRPDLVSDARLGLGGECEAMWQLREQILRVSQLGRPALVLGETGTGKELVAAAIHQNSPRASNPFVTVNCAALPVHLVESLLFGHRKGSFTDATSDSPGRLHAADTGTLFLDELGEMPATVQPKLLRAIQDGEVTAIGQASATKVDVRFLAATNRDPEQEIEAGRLRQDLFFRLAAHIVKVPPLRQRAFDIPALFVHLLGRFRNEHAISWLWEDDDRWRATVPLSFFLALLHHSWPGNVRELENIAERTVSHNLSGTRFRAPPLPATGQRPQPNEPVATNVSKRADSSAKFVDQASELLDIARKTAAKLLNGDALDALSDAMGHSDLALLDASARRRATDLVEARASERLLAILTENDFKQKQTAARLDVSLSTLTKLMHRFGIPRPQDLSDEQISRAIDAAHGDVPAAARALKVSLQGLKKRMTALQTL